MIDHKSVYKWVLDHKSEMIEDIFEMIRIPSVLSEAKESCPYGKPCKDALLKAIEIGQNHGLIPELYGNTVGSAALRQGKIDLAVWGHTDVVPAGDGWDFPPFEPFEKDGKIYGRGATDNKAQVIAGIYAMRCLKELGAELNLNAGVFFGSKEETGMEDIDDWLNNHKEPLFSLVPDASYTLGYAEKGVLRIRIAGEKILPGLLSFKSGTAINVFPSKAEAVFESGLIDHSGLSRLKNAVVEADETKVKLTVVGTSGHSASGSGENNPIGLLLEDIERSSLLTTPIDPLFLFIKSACFDSEGGALGIKCEDEVTGKLHTCATMFDYDGEKLSLSFDIRTPISQTESDLISCISASIDNFGLEVSVLNYREPGYSDPDEIGAKAIEALHADLAPQYGLRQKSRYTLSGGTYARKFTRGYAFGMDAGENAHGPNEYVNLDRIFFGTMLYVMCLQKLDEIYGSDSSNE